MIDHRVCIAMLDPQGRGGVYTLAREFQTMLQAWSVEPSFLYLSASIEDDLSPRQLIRRGRLWDTKSKVNRGLFGLAVGHALAHFRSLAYIWLYPVVWRYINRFDLFIVLGGALRGITLAALGKRYICWIAALFTDEVQAKATMGDPWAQKMVSAPAFSILAWQERLVLRHSALILATSPYTAHTIRLACPDVAERVWVVPCSVDTNVFYPGTKRVKSTPTVLCVGRLDDPRKNLTLMLDAFVQVVAKRPDAKLLLIGDADSESTRQQAKKRGISNQFATPGRVSDSELVSLYRGASLLALPSWQEGLGIVALEAMACGLPVVSTRCGGPEAYIRDGETGYLVPTDDPIAFAEAILSILENDRLREMMGRNAVAWAQETFSRPIVGAQLRRAFELVYPDVVG